VFDFLLYHQFTQLVLENDHLIESFCNLIQFKLVI